MNLDGLGIAQNNIKIWCEGIVWQTYFDEAETKRNETR
jgi:hypothetical protein